MDNGDVQERKPTANTLDWQTYRLLSIQPYGFGEERVKIWPRLVNAGDHSLENKHESSDISVLSDSSLDLDTTKDILGGEPHKDERQIELDTDRSFVLYPVDGVSSRGKLQICLNKLIVSLFRRRPRLHYFQGYHDIVSVIFLTLPKELHLPVTEKVSLHRVRDSMGTNLDPVLGLLSILKRLLHVVDSHFAAILEQTAPLPYYALSNLLTLFSHDVPTLPLIQHIFDYLLCRPPIAVVYLAAAFILTRRQEVQILEDEGEEGMMHSLLTMLPDLYEEGETQEKVQPEEARALKDKPTVERVKVEEPDPSIPPETATVNPTPNTQPRSENVATSELDVHADNTSITPHGPYQGQTEPEKKVEPSDIPLPESDDEDEEPPPRRTSSPEPTEHETHPRRPRISLTALLTQADELFALYPPTHPDIALSSIMGPQSVMLTWSEHASDLPSDDEAELMVTRPDLIVLPQVEEPSLSDEEGLSEKGRDRRRRARDKEERERRRRLRKSRRLTDMVVQKKTMVAGAVLVLGVAMAVYGLNAGLPGSGSGHHRGGLGKECRKMGRLLGGVIMGAGEKVFDGIRRGLE